MAFFWEQRKLFDFTYFYNGLTYTPDDVRENGTLVLRSSNVKHSEIVLNDNVYVDPIKVNSEYVKKGDIIIVVRNGSRALIGKHAVIKDEMPNTVIGAFMSGIRSQYSFFVNSLLDTSQFKEEILRNLGATINQITGYMFSKMEFMIPSCYEQKIIGDYFSKLDNLITLHQCKYFTICDKNRFAWEQRKLEDFGVATGGTSIESEFIEDGKYKVISIGSYSECSKYVDQGIRTEKTPKTKNRILNKNDLAMILNDKTSSGKIIGRVLLIDADDAYVYNQRTERIEVNHNCYVSEFLYHLLNADNIRAKIIRTAQGNTQIYVNWNVIKNFTYDIPINICEQIVIGDCFSKLDDLITLHQRKCENLKKLKKFMLQKMFPQNGENVPKIRFYNFTDTWEQRRLGNVFKEYSEKNHGELPALTIVQGQGTINRNESERNLMYEKSNLSSYKMVRKNDFIVHLRSFEGGLEIATLDGIISPAYHTLHGDNTDSRFYYSYFRSYEFINHGLVPHVYGIRDGRSIDIAGMKTILIPYTSFDEQKKIGNYIETIDRLITLHQSKCDNLKELKKYMLQNMFI